MAEQSNLDSLVTLHHTTQEITQLIQKMKVKRVRLQPYIQTSILEVATVIVNEELTSAVQESRRPLFENPTQLLVHVFEQFVIRHRPTEFHQQLES